MIRGNLLMIPIGESFLFIEPIYLQADTSRIPELKRVMVANGNNIGPRADLPARARRGLRPSRLVAARRRRLARHPARRGRRRPRTTATRPVAPAGDFGELLRQAQEAADAAQAELERLRALLDQIEQSGSQ